MVIEFLALVTLREVLRFELARTFRIEDFMSLIKVIIYAMIFVVSLLLLGRFFF